MTALEAGVWFPHTKQQHKVREHHKRSGLTLYLEQQDLIEKEID